MAACGGGGGGGVGGQTIHGTITLSDPDAFRTHGKPCLGDGGYDDIRAGAQVVVMNETNEIIATSHLQEGVGKDLAFAFWELGAELAEIEDRTAPPTPDLDDSDLEIVQCDFPFEVEVPDATFYSIEVSHRGEIRYSREDLAENDWTVELTLGD